MFCCVNLRSAESAESAEVQKVTMANTPANSAAHVLETQTPNNPSASENSLPDPSMADPRCVKMGSNRAWIAEQERRIEREIIGVICSGKADSLKPNSGKAITVGEHYVCVSFHDDGLDPSYRTWEWHGHVMTPDGSNGYVPEHIYGNFLERVDAAGLYDEEDEEGTEDSDIPIVLGNVNLRFCITRLTRFAYKVEIFLTYADCRFCLFSRVPCPFVSECFKFFLLLLNVSLCFFFFALSKFMSFFLPSA